MCSCRHSHHCPPPCACTGSCDACDHTELSAGLLRLAYPDAYRLHAIA